MKITFKYPTLHKTIALTIVVICVSFFTSCLKDDKPVTKPDINANTIQTLFSTYNTQGYYNLKTMSFVKTNLKTTWDLRFDCNDNFNIWLNTAKFMLVADAGNKSFNEVIDTNGYQFAFDFPSGKIDSNAIAAWGDFSTSTPISYNHLYIVDLGKDADGNQLGFIKMKVKNFTSNSYKIEFTNLSNTSSATNTLIIAKDNEYNYKYVSLVGAGSIIELEPKKTEWDLWFTQYSTWIFDPAQGIHIPYLVIGVLINPYNTEVSYDTTNRFTQIELLEAQSKTYYTNWDIIGYGWKNAGNVTGGGPVLYVTYPEITYMIKTSNSDYFKLHFTDFYNQSGTRGYPKWDQLQL